MHVDYAGRAKDFERANLVALQHLQVLDPFIQEHKEFIRKKYTDRGLLFQVDIGCISKSAFSE